MVMIKRVGWCGGQEGRQVSQTDLFPNGPVVSFLKLPDIRQIPKERQLDLFLGFDYVLDLKLSHKGVTEVVWVYLCTIGMFVVCMCVKNI